MDRVELEKRIPLLAKEGWLRQFGCFVAIRQLNTLAACRGD